MHDGECQYEYAASQDDNNEIDADYNGNEQDDEHADDADATTISECLG